MIFFSLLPLRPGKRAYFIGVLLLVCLNACSQHTDSGPTLHEKIGQMITVGFRGLEAPRKSPVARAIRQQEIGGVVLFDYDVPADSAVRNIRSPQQLQSLTRQLQRYAEVPLFITIDQEGGRVARLKEKFGFPKSVSAQYLGDINNTDSTRFYARRTAQMLTDAGINVNLAPVVDLNTNPDNPVIGGLDRSFSANADTVFREARTYINTLHSYNILTTLKHFPGHGSSDDDSHKGIVDVTETWRQNELIPYKRLIESGQVDIIMTAHIFNARWDSTYPATLSKPVITGMLRDSLGFQGVVMSDDLQMGAIRKYYGLKETIRQTIQAGVDVLVFANNSIFDDDIAKKAHQIITQLVEEGALSEERIDKSYNRIMQLKEKIKE